MPDHLAGVQKSTADHTHLVPMMYQGSDVIFFEVFGQTPKSTVPADDALSASRTYSSVAKQQFQPILVRQFATPLIL
ncbi:MAG: hypothetical protein KAS94_01050, partial [Desulfobulbaceae bacterium]|nr:hypothetical protein [Desulfobulbaceae bacterium]